MNHKICKLLPDLSSWLFSTVCFHICILYSLNQKHNAAQDILLPSCQSPLFSFSSIFVSKISLEILKKRSKRYNAVQDMLLPDLSTCHSLLAELFRHYTFLRRAFSLWFQRPNMLLHDFGRLFKQRRFHMHQHFLITVFIRMLASTFSMLISYQKLTQSECRVALKGQAVKKCKIPLC